MNDSYISFSKMRTFLKAGHYSGIYEAMQALEQYISANPSDFSYKCPFSKNSDVIIIPDEDFLGYCDDLPILVSSRAYKDPLSFRSLVPPGYDCFITRHLNELPGMKYEHDFFEICYVWKGSCLQQFNSQTVSLYTGDFLIIPPGFQHKIIVEDPDSVIFYILVKSTAFRNSYGTFLMQKNALSTFLTHCLFDSSHRYCLQIHSDEDLLLKRILKHFILECYVEQTIFCDFASGILNQLFSYMILYGEVRSDLLGLPDNLTFLALLRDIQENYKTVTLHALAEKYHFAEESLSRMIRKMTGKTFTSLLSEIRMEQACLLLSSTDYPLEQIGEIIGYQEYSSFYRAFHKETGMSPRKYRSLYWDTRHFSK